MSSSNILNLRESSVLGTIVHHGTCVQVHIGGGRCVGQVVGLVGDLCCRQWRGHLRIRVVTDLDLGNPNVEGGQTPVACTEGNEKGDSPRPSMKKVCGGSHRCGCCNDGVGARHWRWRRDGAYMRHWLSLVRVFDSLKNTMAVYRGLGREKRICCEGWDGRH